MMQQKTRYITLIALILAFAACDKLAHDQTGEEPAVHLLVNTRAAHLSGEESINVDEIDSEDRVHDLAMLVFQGGSLVGEPYFRSGLGSGASTYAFTAELTPGLYDFYFVANMPIAGLQAISNPSEMNAYMNMARELDPELYAGAAEAKGFPMARVYLNQTVTAGGTLYEPKPFKPVVDAVEQPHVELIRMVAKLEVNLEGTDLGVENIYFRNANRDYYLANPSPMPPSGYFNDNAVDVPLKQVGANRYIYYMPEAIVQSATWDPSPGAQNKPVNYFTIVTESGTEYDIPIISNETSITSGYLAKATGQEDGFGPNYTIKRNDHYRYVIRNLDKIEILYQIVEWNRVDKALYMGYGYDVEVEGTSVSLHNTIETCDPYHVRLVTTGGITFSDGTTQKDFTDVNPAASTSYELSAEPVSGQGEYLRVYFIDVDTAADTPVHVFSK